MLKKKTGTYNIGSGKKVNLETIATIFCKKLNKKAFFLKGSNDFTHLVSNNQKLCKIGWKPKYDFINELNKFK